MGTVFQQMKNTFEVPTSLEPETDQSLSGIVCYIYVDICLETV